MQRKANAVWENELKTGTGKISTETKVLLNVPYSFGTRFENVPGTNPEELVAAAHAACFSMALSGELEKKGIHSNSISTSATATFEKLKDGWRVTEMHLDVVGDISNMDESLFESAANEAKMNCPVSRLLNTKITMSAKVRQKAA